MEIQLPAGRNTTNPQQIEVMEFAEFAIRRLPIIVAVFGDYSRYSRQCGRGLIKPYSRYRFCVGYMTLYCATL